ncbi:unnamed protein product [Chrysodeixis includens]|uniref:Lebocin n=1 Tax=Chrysodeixis includens TaxID=689277 RepID=Q6QMF1_CHRIL|nr:lebocin [Chrysodeixis includens]CAH0599147.1 unnamed protein product [Chrysodeixis includens]
MSKYILILCVLSAFLIAEATCQRIILPTYRPPPAPRRPVIMRARREAEEPLIFHGEETYSEPGYVEVSEIEHGERVERSLGTPSRSRGGGGSRPSGSRDTGPTHPGYNRRNARSLPDFKLPGMKYPIPATTPPFVPKRSRFPIYA